MCHPLIGVLQAVNDRLQRCQAPRPGPRPRQRLHHAHAPIKRGVYSVKRLLGAWQVFHFHRLRRLIHRVGEDTQLASGYPKVHRRTLHISKRGRRRSLT